MNSTGLCLAIVGSLLPVLEASAAPRVWHSDDVVAGSPVVVIGYCTRWSTPSRIQVKDGDEVREEHQSRLVVTKVLHGQLSAGEYPLLQGHVDWPTQGRQSALFAMSGSSPVEARDITQPCVWFLEWARSTDEKDRRTYLRVKFGEYVQEAKFARYYEILRRPDRKLAIARCLNDSDPEIVQRSLKFTCGWSEPWPLSFGHFSKEIGAGEQPLPLKQLLPAVKRVVASKLESCRALAEAIYAMSTGPSSIPLLRGLLRDPNPDVAAVAACYLARFKDVSTAPNIREACPRIKAADLACELVLEMGAVKEDAFVPALIFFLDSRLQAGMSASIDGVDWRMPAFYAHSALRTITGYSFPYDAESSARAWQKVRTISNRAERALEMIRQLGNWEHPLRATYAVVRDSAGNPAPSTLGDHFSKAFGELHKNDAWFAKIQEDSKEFLVQFTVTNTSNHPVSLAGLPAGIEVSSVRMIGSGSVASSPFRVINLGPGQSIAFHGAVRKRALDDPGAKIWLEYLPRRDWTGTKMWIGILKANSPT